MPLVTEIDGMNVSVLLCITDSPGSTGSSGRRMRPSGAWPVAVRIEKLPPLTLLKSRSLLKTKCSCWFSAISDTAQPLVLPQPRSHDTRQKGLPSAHRTFVLTPALLPPPEQLARTTADNPSRTID